MQRPSFLRPSSVLIVLVAVLGANAGLVMAGEYTYAMAAAEVADATPSGESVTVSGVGANNRVEGMGARYLVSQDEVPAASTGLDDSETPSAVQFTAPSGSSGPATDKRASHRWQALVPGAIK